LPMRLRPIGPQWQAPRDAPPGRVGPEAWSRGGSSDCRAAAGPRGPACGGIFVDEREKTTMLKQRVRRLESLVKGAGLAGGKRTNPPPRRLQTAQDLIDLLQEQVEALRADAWAGTLPKARAIGFLAGIARKAIADGQVAARIEMLEAVLKRRAG